MREPASEEAQPHQGPQSDHELPKPVARRGRLQRGPHPRCVRPWLPLNPETDLRAWGPPHPVQLLELLGPQ